MEATAGEMEGGEGSLKHRKATKRQRRRKWPWRHGEYPNGEFLDGNQAKQIETWYRRHRNEAMEAIRRLTEAVDRHAAKAKAEGRPLPPWHPDSDYILHCRQYECRLYYEQHGTHHCLHGAVEDRGGMKRVLRFDKAPEAVDCPWFHKGPDRYTEGLRWHHDPKTALVPLS